MHRLIDLKMDFAFKQIFGKVGNEHILMAFLNAALQLPPGERITSVEFLNTELPRMYPDEKSSFLDIYVKTENDVHINVEIQLANRYDMEKRTLFYWARIFIMQLKKQMSYKNLSKTITINLLDFRFFHATERFHTTFHLYEDHDKTPLTDLLEIHFLEIPKVMDKWKRHELNPEEDALARWLLLLEAHEDQEIFKQLEAIAMKDPVLDDLFDQWEDMSYDNKKWFQYESLRKAHWDAVSDREYKEELEKQVKEAEQQLRAVGEQIEEVKQRAEEAEQQAKEAEQQAKEAEQQAKEAEQQAKEAEQQAKEAEQQAKEAEQQAKEAEQQVKEAAEKGLEQGVVLVARKLLQMGMETSVVAQGTGLSLEEIKQLQ